MNRIALLEPVAFLLLLGTIVYAWASLAPESPLEHLLSPPYFATLAAVLVWINLVIARTLVRPRRLVLERFVLASFLAGMPFIYFWAAALAGDRGGMLLEGAGIFVYGGLAVWGFRSSPLILGLGIAAHGIGWDLWHHGHSAYMPDWYAWGCLLVDVAFAFLVWTQLPAHRPEAMASGGAVTPT